MFGYIAPMKSELKIKDFYLLKKYYCGLCMTIKNKYGNLPRIGLNYDSTFFAVLFDSMNLEKTSEFQTFCIKHPKNKQTCIKTNKALNYAADLNIALLYYKFLDDIHDDSNIKSTALYKFITPYHNKLTHKNIDSIIEPNLRKLRYYEVTGNFKTIDEVCHPFSHILGEILKEIPFKLTSDSPKVRDILYNLGYSLGKWIYLLDALDDLKKDMERGMFNPLNKLYNSSGFCYENLIIDIKEYIDFILTSLCINCSDALAKLPIIRNQSLLDNIINSGLENKYIFVLKSL